MTEHLVMDASVAIRIVRDDEPGHAEARATHEAILLAGTDTIAPRVFTFEVGNVIARAKAPSAVREARFAEARRLATPVDLEEPGLIRTFAIAAEGRLSFYDASYVALAEQLGTRVWTEDKEILKRFPGHSASTEDLARRPR